VVNWNTREDLRECLRSFSRPGRGFPIELIVIDNGSTDGSAEEVRRAFPSVRLLANRENRGFAAAVNQGLTAASGEHLFILNPDVMDANPPSEGDVLDTLLRFLRGAPRVGAAAPRLVHPDGSPQEGYFRRFPSVLQILLFHTLLAPLSARCKRLTHRFLDGSGEDTGAQASGGGEGSGASDAVRAEEARRRQGRAVDQIPGGCLLVRREAVESVGPMDERFRLFYEDVDWCYRMRRAGWELRMLPGATLVHLGGRSVTGPGREWIYGRFLLSLNQYVDKHGSLFSRAATKVLTFGNSLLIVPVRGLQILLGASEPARRSFRKHRLFLEMFLGHYAGRLFPRCSRGELPQ